jgi:hypothetical protein
LEAGSRAAVRSDDHRPVAPTTANATIRWHVFTAPWRDHRSSGAIISSFFEEHMPRSIKPMA